MKTNPLGYKVWFAEVVKIGEANGYTLNKTILSAERGYWMDLWEARLTPQQAWNHENKK